MFSLAAHVLCILPTAIGRTLIPRYFSTVFEGGVTDLYYILKHSKESYHSSSITVDCEQCTMVSQHGKPMFTKVIGKGDVKHANNGCSRYFSVYITNVFSEC